MASVDLRDVLHDTLFMSVRPPRVLLCAPVSRLLLVLTYSHAPSAPSPCSTDPAAPSDPAGADPAVPCSAPADAPCAAPADPAAGAGVLVLIIAAAGSSVRWTPHCTRECRLESLLCSSCSASLRLHPTCSSECSYEGTFRHLHRLVLSAARDMVESWQHGPCSYSEQGTPPKVHLHQAGGVKHQLGLPALA